MIIRGAHCSHNVTLYCVLKLLALSLSLSTVFVVVVVVVGLLSFRGRGWNNHKTKFENSAEKIKFWILFPALLYVRRSQIRLYGTRVDHGQIIKKDLLRISKINANPVSRKISHNVY